ncbi:MAG TPA: Na+/H+ antiporter NhaA, partial [Anaerolineales bacterium]|nr:Na+/H+ antiporter NhaA [Anaerolineales bacterium]
DLECIHCRKVNPIIRALREQVGSRLRYVYRHFPISSIHPDSQLAAQATEAAAAQGKFWEMQETLFDHQGELDESHLIQYAAEIGLDVGQFEHELKEGVYSEHVSEDFHSGIQSGVNGTPSFFINGERYEGAWDLESLIEAIEKPLGVKVRLIFQEFARIEASGGIILLICAILALLWANSQWAEYYYQLWATDFGITFGDFSFTHHLLEWVNNGLMVIFFFVVGLEIKRELTTGELANLKRAMLPIMAAIGGMLVPAGTYLLLNAGNPGMPGWGIPMATDIAFTLGIMALLGLRAPLSLKIFFTALAIADDLGAVLVIAMFYTSEISWIYLLIAALIFIALIGLNRSRVYSPLPYALLGIGLWAAFLGSGIHATIAGVLLALTIPTRSPPNTQALLAQCVAVMNEFDKPTKGRIPPEEQQQVAAQTLGTVADRMQSPAQRMEHDLHPWTTYLILPTFALANAGVTLEFTESLISPVSLGIILGLVFGKPLGITLFSWIAVKSRLAELPANISWLQVFCASWLAGVGFTMALFIASAAFDSPLLLSQAKLGILIASLVAGIIGFVLMRVFSPTYSETTHLEIAPAAD